MIRKTASHVRALSPLAVKQERMREHILEAAAQAFARGGYHTTPMDDVARAAGFSAPSLYTYFKGKQEILLALAEDTEAHVRSCFEEAVPQGLGFVQQFELLLHRLVQYVDAHRDALTVLFAAEQELERAQTGSGMRGFPWLHGLFSAWLGAHAGAGDLGRYSAPVAAQYLTGIAFASFFRWVGGEVDEVPQLAAEIRDIFLHGVAGGASP